LYFTEHSGNILLIFMKISAMSANWWIIGIVAFCILVVLVYLIWKNYEDEKEITKTYFNDEMKTEKHVLDDEDI